MQFSYYYCDFHKSKRMNRVNNMRLYPHYITLFSLPFYDRFLTARTKSSSSKILRLPRDFSNRLLGARPAMKRKWTFCHCEECSDEAISRFSTILISAVLSLTPGTAFCYNSHQHLWRYLLAGSIHFICQKFEIHGFVLLPKR